MSREAESNIENKIQSDQPWEHESHVSSETNPLLPRTNNNNNDKNNNNTTHSTLTDNNSRNTNEAHSHHNHLRHRNATANNKNRNNKYAFARSRHVSSSSFKNKFENMFVKFMDCLPLCISHHFFPPIDSRLEELTNRLKVKCNCSFDIECSEHIELLQRLWCSHGRVMFDNSPFNINDNKWKEMGFQSSDPTRDFRGAGTFALTQLIYLVEEHPAWWNEICTPDFLAAVCGINITMKLLTLLQVNNKRNLLQVQHKHCFSDAAAREKLLRYIQDVDEQVIIERLNQVYCAYIYSLHQRWIESDQNLMNMNILLNSLYKEMNYSLLDSKSLTEFLALTAENE